MLTKKQAEARLNKQTAPRVTSEGMRARIAHTEFMRIGETMTMCILTIDNGYTVRGESACVSPENYDQELGEKYSFEDAVKKLWPLFGFLLAETIMLQRIADDMTGCKVSPKLTLRKPPTKE